MAVKIIRKHNRFRVEGQEISLDWLADTRANRKAAVVFLRLLSTHGGKPLFTHQQLAQVVNSSNRQAASNHFELFRACGDDFIDFLSHKRKVDDKVVSAVLTELSTDPLAESGDLQVRVNARLGRDDLSVANINVALEQISAKQIRQPMQKQLARGNAHYKEAYLLKEMLRSLDTDVGKKAGITADEADGMVLSDPTAVRKLVSPETAVSEIDKPLKWMAFLMALYYHGVPLSVLGQWFSVHKTTVLRWILGLSLALWPHVSVFLVSHVKGTIVYIDEKWIKIKGQWHYWFVVLDHTTGLPIVAELLKSRSQWACQWIGIQLKRIQIIPRVIVTDGLASYRYLLEGVTHLTCLFHHQQRVTHWLKKHFAEKAEIAQRKPLMKRLFQTQDKRTVKRRLEKLKASAKE
jgi:transposase-like protein